MHLQLLWALFLFQDAGQTVQWDPIHLWIQMGTLAKCVVIGLFIMSAYSIGVMIDRYMAFGAARKQSRSFAPAVAGALREGKLDEAIKIAEQWKAKAKMGVYGLLRNELWGQALAAYLLWLAR